MTAFVCAILPEKTLDRLTLSSNRLFYERLGVRFIRKLVQNGDAVKRAVRNRAIVTGASRARLYLKTLVLYERFHWTCLIFFLLTAVRCFFPGHGKLGWTIMAANIVYNVSAILLQQYNKIRLGKITG